MKRKIRKYLRIKLLLNLYFIKIITQVQVILINLDNLYENLNLNSTNNYISIDLGIKVINRLF